MVYEKGLKSYSKIKLLDCLVCDLYKAGILLRLVNQWNSIYC